MSEGSSKVKTLDRALDLVEALSRHRQGVTVTRLASELEIPKSRVFRFLDTLRSRGYVRKDEEGARYYLDTGFLAIARSVDAGGDLRSLARPHLLRLRDEVEETVHLAVPSGAGMVYIDKFDSGKPVGMASYVGQRLPLHCTSLGKAYLGHLQREECDRLLSALSLERRTDNTTVERQALIEELTAIKEQGYAMDDIENEDGVRCVGAALRDTANDPVAAISVSAPSYRFTRERAAELGLYCLDVADRISADVYGAPPSSGKIS